MTQAEKNAFSEALALVIRRAFGIKVARTLRFSRGSHSKPVRSLFGARDRTLFVLGIKRAELAKV